MKVYVISNGVGDYYGPYFREVCATRQAADKYIASMLPGSYSTADDWQIEEKELIGATEDQGPRGTPKDHQSAGRTAGQRE